jgi:hypothetical protein
MLAHSGSGSSQAIEAIALIKLSPFYNRVWMNSSPMTCNKINEINKIVVTVKLVFFGFMNIEVLKTTTSLGTQVHKM